MGIGLTWDARAVVEGNLVTRYWKGIGVFVDAQATTGACGAMIARSEPAGPGEGEEAPGRLVDNFLVRTGQNDRYDDGDPYCT